MERAELIAGDNADWSERGEYWRGKTVDRRITRSRKQKTEPGPLVLSGYGIRIAVDRGTLFIQNGFTHYPQQPEEYRYFPGDRQLAAAYSDIGQQRGNHL